jgi:hypothetical protein
VWGVEFKLSRAPRNAPTTLSQKRVPQARGSDRAANLTYSDNMSGLRLASET